MPGTVKFDHYEVLTRDDGSLYELGRGAMGTTYKAFDTSLHCEVALKVINAGYLDSEVARQRFVREARAAAKLRHRNVATVFHLGEENGAWFYAMEFIAGETVEALIKRQGALDPLLALRITAQVARALNAAYEEKLVHRDIKPSNLMIVREDDELVAKVIDFGLAKSSHRDDGEDPATISMGGFVGTPHFASPEQLEERDIDVRSDIYSLGATLWYMLAGRAPFAGTMAQVMSQHLSAPPPFKQFSSWPKPVTDLLQKMLEKDPAGRPQTPAELRQDIERCIEKLSGGTGALGGGAASSQEFPTVTAMAGDEPAEDFSPGSVVGGRFRIIENLGDGSAGVHYLADLSGRKVRLIALPPLEKEALGRLEGDVTKLQPIHHSNLLEVIGIERVGETSVLVLEWNRGFSLTDLLRARRELSSRELIPLLQQAAAGIDFAVSKEIATLDFALHHILIDFTEGNAPELHTPVSAWPAFALKLMPVSVTRESSTAETWAGGMTLDAGLARGAQTVPATLPVPARYLSLLGTLTYELLGGAGSRVANRYVPLATLTEAGNEVLKRCLDPVRGFPSAREFASALEQAEAGQYTPPPPAVPARQASGAQAAPPSLPVSPVPANAGADASGKERTSSGVPLGVAAAIAAVLLLGGGAGYYFVSKNKAAPGDPAATPTPVAHVSPAQTPVAEPSATPEQRVAETTPTPVPTPTPETREAKLRKALDAAKSFESTGDWRNAMDAYLAINRDYPESDAGKVNLGIISERLRAAQPKLTETQVLALREQLEEAAKLDIVSAMMLLADNLLKVEPDTAFNWFCAAAHRGQPSAYTQVGLIYSNGAGKVPRDFAQAFWWLQQGAELKDTAAISLVAECYLYGKGVAKDPKHAVELLKQAVAEGDPRAMNLLGTCYQRGTGTEPNFPEALSLFTSAQEKGFLDALGNLGVLYINGEGVQADPQKAAALFQKGAKAGNSYCMFLFARCLEGGIGIETNKLAAESWYRKSAEAGHKGAIDWCKKNGIQLTGAGQ